MVASSVDDLQARMRVPQGFVGGQQELFSRDFNGFPMMGDVDFEQRAYALPGNVGTTFRAR